MVLPTIKDCRSFETKESINDINIIKYASPKYIIATTNTKDRGIFIPYLISMVTFDVPWDL